MAVDKLKVMLSYMREIDDDNIPTASDYEITEKEFSNVLEACQDAGYIKGLLDVTTLSSAYKQYLTEQVRLTVKGMEYLHTHSKTMQTYKGLKEIREWLPF